jgi:signal transduction histidine kinase
VERVAHVRSAIKRSIEHLEEVAVAVAFEGDDEAVESNELLKKHMKAQAICQFSGVLLHELSPKLGLLRATAKSEFAGYYEGSEVRKHIDGVFRILEAVKNLGLSSSPPKIDQVDLHEVIAEVCAEEISKDIDVHFVGTQPCVVKCGPSLLRLALSNAVRNAGEALLSLEEGSPKKLIISWGVTDVDYWVSVIDEGPGLKGSAEEAFVIGATNKAGHTGFGLGIIKQAMESMEGDAKLSSVRGGGGAKLVMRWNVVGD